MSADDQIRNRVARSVRHIDPDVGTALDRVSRRGRRRRRLAVAAGISVAASLLTLIGVAAPGILDLLHTPPRPPAEGSPAGPYSAIAGTYRTTIASQPGVVTRAGMAGRWTLRLDPDGSLYLGAPPGLRAETSGVSFRIVGPEFQTNAFPNDLCPSRRPGKYRWARIVGQLRFTIVEDPCEARAILFAGQTWTEGSR
jgi:hypothetical protein